MAAPETEREPVPPLANDVRDRILSHLVPPTLPLPPDCLSRSFIERLTFLPPAETELDAHITPYPKPAGDDITPHPLTTALERLAGGFVIKDTEYTYDGEMTIGRSVITPEYGHDGAVEINFEHEAGDKGRGWVYRGAKEYSARDPFSWKSDVEHVEYSAYGAAGDAPEDYWAAFTPPGGHSELPGDDNEDDYWAQYGAGAPEPEHEHHKAAEDEPVTPEAATIPTPDPAATLSLLLQGMNGPKEGVSDDVETESNQAKSKDAGVLEQKIRAKVRAQLMRAWSDFSADQDAEAAGYDWLRIGREVAERPSWGAAPSSAQSDLRTAVVTARLEAAKDMHEVLDEEKDHFWRLLEEAIRIHNSPVMDGDAQPEFEFS